MSRSFVVAPRWSSERLAGDRATSIAGFVAERQSVEPGEWAEHFRTTEQLVSEVFDATDDLRAITARCLLEDPQQRWHVLRYCCGPPVSEEDLWTYVGGPKFKRVPTAWASSVAEKFTILIDDVRFPWVRQGRSPSHGERQRALFATVMPLAQQRFATKGRGEASQRQEASVAAALDGAGYRLDESRAEMWVTDDLPRGHYSRERRMAGDKCDVPLRLADGRLLAIECKSSNGPKNGWKRLLREVGGKADAWNRAFGNQIVTAAVLAGVYDLTCLERAQERGVVVFWEHDLEALLQFAEAAC